MSEAHRTPLPRYATLPGDPAPLRRDLALLRAMARNDTDLPSEPTEES
jgi:hypothetical protein